MSITLTAFPTAFLISPESSKNINLTQVLSKNKNKSVRALASNFASLKSVRVLTNLRMGEIQTLMSVFDDAQTIADYTYKFRNGLVVQWKYQDGFCCAVLTGKPTYKTVPKYAEEFFKTLENIKRNNVRDINSEEFFYYNYQTEYINVSQIVEELQFRGAKNIENVSDCEVKAYYNNQNIRYYLPKDSDKFVLETEQKISLVNIGIDNSLIANIEIKTNLTSEELKFLLKIFGYDFNEVTSQTSLKMSSNIIDWELKDGMYSAHLKNIKASHLRGEVEHLFLAMNNKMGRDVRIINNKTSFTYTYNTNYTDKGVLINTLTEHGAKNLSESNGIISCELFGMVMKYSKEDDSEAYKLVIERVTDKSECEGLISDLNDEYGLNIQEITYKKILERIGSQNMRLESEEVLDDNSIVLTIEV